MTQNLTIEAKSLNGCAVAAQSLRITGNSRRIYCGLPVDFEIAFGYKSFRGCINLRPDWWRLHRKRTWNLREAASESARKDVHKAHGQRTAGKREPVDFESTKMPDHLSK